MNALKQAVCFFFMLLTGLGIKATYSPDAFVGDIQQRYYLIRRLEGTVDLLIKAYDVQATKVPPVKSQDLRQFSDPIVQDCMQTIRESGTIESFHKVWEHFLSYRFIDKPAFSRETVLLMLILYNQILSTTPSRSLDMQNQCDRVYCCLENNSEDELASEMQQMGLIQEISGASVKHQSELLQLLTHHHTLDDVSPVMGSHNLQYSYNSLVNIVESEKRGNVVINNNVRFYYIQRLLRSIFVLSRYRYTLKPFGPVCACFRHERIQNCVQALQRTGSIEPLLKLWKHFVSYDFIDDEFLLKELIQLIACVYQHIEIEVKGERISYVFNANVGAKTSVDTAVYLYEVMQDLPVSELLDMLDEIVDQFEVFSDTYELHNNELSWCAWLKRYWWSMPRLVGKIALIIMRHARALGITKGLGTFIA